MSNIATIGRIGLVSVLAIIIAIAAAGVYASLPSRCGGLCVATDTFQMTTAKTTSTDATTYTTPFVTTNNSISNNTQTVINNYTLTTTVPSEINSTSSVESSETACIPSPYYDSTTTLFEQSTTKTEQVYYDGTTCDFGDAFEAPSAILIPANTLTWTNFQLNESGSYSVFAGFDFLPIPEARTANLTVAVYLNGKLNGTTPYAESDYSTAPELTNSSQIPPSNSSSNSIFALPGVILTSGTSGQADSMVNLSDTTITVAIISDKPLWLTGWTQAEMSQGTGAQFGQSLGQLKGTYEWPDSELSLPNLLPQPSTTLTFELRITGNYGT